ncbi:MAG: hypothetical protein U1E62_09345 [Alsobacter sp.]
MSVTTVNLPTAFRKRPAAAQPGAATATPTLPKVGSATLVDATATPNQAYKTDLFLSWDATKAWSFGTRAYVAGAKPVYGITGEQGPLLVKGSAAAGERLIVAEAGRKYRGGQTLRSGISFADGTGDFKAADLTSAGIDGPVLKVSIDGKITYLSQVDLLYFTDPGDGKGAIQFAIGTGTNGNDVLDGATIRQREAAAAQAGGQSASGDGYGVILLGGAGNDVLEALASSNTLHGGDGDDVLSATNVVTTANVVLDGGDGADTLTANSASSTLLGGAGNDVLWSGQSFSSLDAGDGADTLVAYGAFNKLSAGAGNDSITVSGFRNVIDGGADHDTIVVTGDHNTITGGAGNDTITVSGPKNVIQGGAGDDTIIVTGDNNQVAGGAGADHFKIVGLQNVVYGSAANDYADMEQDAFYLGAPGSTNAGTDGSNSVCGNRGEDAFFVYSARNQLDLGGYYEGRTWRTDGDRDTVYIAEGVAKVTKFMNVGAEDYVYVATTDQSHISGQALSAQEIADLFGSNFGTSHVIWTTPATMDTAAKAAGF